MPDQIALHLAISGYAAMVLPVLCFTVMFLFPPARRGDGLGWLVESLLLLGTGRFRWLAASVVVLVVMFHVMSIVVAAALILILVAAAMLPTDPRLAISIAVLWTDLRTSVVGDPSSSVLTVILLVGVAPAVLAVTITRTRRLQRRSRT